jgi:hypothetical protein
MSNLPSYLAVAIVAFVAWIGYLQYQVALGPSSRHDRADVPTSPGCETSSSDRTTKAAYLRGIGPAAQVAQTTATTVRLYR